MEKTQHNIVDPEASLKHHCRHRPVHRPPSPFLSEIMHHFPRGYDHCRQKILVRTTKSLLPRPLNMAEVAKGVGSYYSGVWPISSFFTLPLFLLIELLLSSDSLVTPLVFDSKTKQAREVKHMESKLVAVLDMLRRHSFCGKAWCARTIFKTLEKNSIWSMDA